MVAVGGVGKHSIYSYVYTVCIECIYLHRNSEHARAEQEHKHGQLPTHVISLAPMCCVSLRSVCACVTTTTLQSLELEMLGMLSHNFPDCSTACLCAALEKVNNVTVIIVTVISVTVM
jgi:hypothetical protein